MCQSFYHCYYYYYYYYYYCLWSIFLFCFENYEPLFVIGTLFLDVLCFLAEVVQEGKEAGSRSSQISLIQHFANSHPVNVLHLVRADRSLLSGTLYMLPVSKPLEKVTDTVQGHTGDPYF